MKKPIIIPGGAILYDKIATLKKVKTDVINWEIFYLDEITGEKWVEEKPYSEMHAGGPSQLRLLEKFPWEDEVS